jgi:hypothetical protein
MCFLTFQQDFLSNLAGGGLNVDIQLLGEAVNALPMDHHPSWKLHKNPFWRVKHPSLAKREAPHLVDETAANVVNTSLAPGVALSRQMYAYESSQDVEGLVVLTLAAGKKIDHLGIKIQFIGRIDMVWIMNVSIFIRITLTDASCHCSLVVCRVLEFMRALVVRIMILFPSAKN